MGIEAEMFKKGKQVDLWKRCCGYLDLSIEDFMHIQKRLMLEQLELLNKCELGKVIMGDAKPETVEDFRLMVPLTTYADYAPVSFETPHGCPAAETDSLAVYFGQIGRIPVQMGAGYHKTARPGRRHYFCHDDFIDL